MRKLLALLLAVSVTIIQLTGCGTNPATPGESNPQASASSTNTGTEDVYNISVLVAPGTYPQNSSDTEVGKYILDKFGINFKYISYAGDIREKQNLMLAAGDYNELMYMQREDIVQNYIKAGVLLPLDDYLKDMPEFEKRYSKQIPYWRLSGDDGKLYKWEVNTPNETYESNDILVRSDLLEENGWKYPVSADEWIAFLKKSLKNHPTTDDGMATVGMIAPMAESWGLAGCLPILYEKGENYSPIGNESFTYNLKTKQFEEYFSNPDVKASFEFFNELYREGLLDEECFTDNMDKLVEKAQQGRALTVWYGVWIQAQANSALVANGKENLQYVKMPIQSNEQVAQGQKRQLRIETTRPFDSWAITNKCKDPAKILALINWAASDEGQLMLQNGSEGVLWTRDANGLRQPTEELLKVAVDPQLNLKYGIIGGSTNPFPGMPWFAAKAPDGQFFNVLLEPSVRDRNLPERVLTTIKNCGFENSESWYTENGYLAETGLAGAITLDPTSELGKTNQKLAEIRIKHSSRLVFSETVEEFEANYKTALDEYNKLDHAAVVSEMNRLLNEKDAALQKYIK